MYVLDTNELGANMQISFLAIVAILAGTGPSADTVSFKAKEVLVSDADGVPLFRGRRDFVLKIARNPTGEVVAYDAAAKRVRVSTVGTQLWVNCAELEPMVTSCPEAATRPSRAGSIRGSDELAPPNLDALLKLVPSCPGDVRCPKPAE